MPYQNQFLHFICNAELDSTIFSRIPTYFVFHSTLRSSLGFIRFIFIIDFLYLVFLQGYGFSVSQFYDLLLEVRDQYTEILMIKWVQLFQDIFGEDDYTAILVRDEEEYYYIIKKFPYIDEQLEKVTRGCNLCCLCWIAGSSRD